MAKTGPVTSASDAAANWKQGMQGASSRYQAGIKKTTVNPMAAAATPQAMQAYQDGVMRSVSSGRRAQALNATSMETWRNNALQYGAAALATGAAKAAPKYQGKYNPAVYQAARDAVANMPKGGQANATARASAAIAAMMQAAGTA